LNYPRPDETTQRGKDADGSSERGRDSRDVQLVKCPRDDEFSCFGIAVDRIGEQKSVQRQRGVRWLRAHGLQQITSLNPCGWVSLRLSPMCLVRSGADVPPPDHWVLWSKTEGYLRLLRHLP